MRTVLLIEALREYTSSLGDTQQGWLRGLTDPGIAKALGLIHSDIAARWTSSSLAKEAALSRSAFMERFSTLVGVPPMRYLTRWRLQTAKRLLTETSMSIAQIASGVGYESEEGFRRAFQREYQQTPSAWRIAATQD